MAGKGSKSQTPVSDQSQPAILEPSARAKRMMKLGTYVLQGPSSDPNRLQAVAEVSQEGYRRMEEERAGAAVVVKAPKQVTESPEPEKQPELKPAKPAKPAAKPKSKSESKRVAAQKESKAKKPAKPKKDEKPSTKEDVIAGINPPESVGISPDPDVVPNGKLAEPVEPADET